jgi:putative (di)nucleoside polyphosphate hydrolase
MKMRKAIGAIIFKDDKFLLIRRGIILDSSDNNNGYKKIIPEWDLLKGGIESKESTKQALLRELYEETGSKNYVISKQFKDKLIYGLPKSTGFDRQEVTMFLVGYVGDGKDLKPDSKEIVELKFFSKLEAMKNIRYPETKEFFENNVNM